MDVNINEVAIEVEVGTNNFTNTTQQVLVKTHNKELLVDYFKSMYWIFEHYATKGTKKGGQPK